MDYNKLAAELKSAKNDSLKDIFLQHSKYCIGRLVKDHKCSREDAEDIYVDSVLNFREKVIDDKINGITDLRNYLYATCRNMLFVRFKKEKRVTDAASAFVSAMDDENIFEDEGQISYREQIFRITEKSIGLLPEKCQHLLKAFYFDKFSLEVIAVKFNFASANVAKVSKSRCFQKLLRIVEQQNY
jgi:RNA polymerase sigma factor (sigma-70 family)